jgi:hypothetical protein
MYRDGQGTTRDVDQFLKLLNKVNSDRRAIDLLLEWKKLQ